MFNNKLIGLGAIALTLMSASGQAAVWTSTNTWNQEWEDKYSNWVETSFNEDFFTSGKYAGIPTDCADAVYAARIIYSFENGLPFSMKDPTGGNSLITNNMSRFDGTKDSISRLKKFLNFTSQVGSTKSLPNDTYPVSINRENVRAGTVWSRPRITRENIFSRIFGGTVQEDPGHAEVVKSVSDTGAIYLIGSTVPQAIRKLQTTSSLVFMPVETSTGLRNWLQPDFFNLQNSQLPGFSLEQFTTIGNQVSNNFNGEGGGPTTTTRNISTWTSDVQSKLALREENRDEAIRRQAKNVCTLATSRIDAVKKAVAYKNKINGCMNAEDYDSYSTPSRDKRIVETLDSMAKASGKFGFSLSQKISKLRSYLDECPELQISESEKIALSAFATSLLNGNVSSNPNDELRVRWGLEGKSQNTCPTY